MVRTLSACPAECYSVVSDGNGLRSIARCNSIHSTVAVIRTWPASVTQLSARCTDDEDPRCEVRPEVGVVRSGVAQPVGPPASSSPGRCACGLPGNRRYIRAPVAGGVDRSAVLRDQALHGEHCRPGAPPLRWHKCSTAPHGDVEIRRFRVTHPYHPLFQQEFELVSYRQDWGEDRVWFQDKLGHLHSLPTSWTDAGDVDPFVALAAGRSLFRVADLIELARQIAAGKSEQVARSVKENMS